MKNFIFLLAFLFVFSFGFAQENQEPTPETEIVIVNPDGSETTMTMDEFEKQMDNYAQSNAYQAPDGSMVVPQSNETNEILKQQLEYSKKTGVDYVPGSGSSRNDRQIGMSYVNQWGIPNTFSAYVDTAALFTGDASARKFDAHFHAGAYILGSQIEVIGIGVIAQNAEGAPADVEAYCRVFGAEYKWSGKLEFQWSKQGEYSASTVIVIGCIPVTVTGIVGGQLGFHAYLSIVEGGIQGTVVPNVVLWGKAEAKVSILFVEVGIRGEIVFLNDSLPITGSARLLPDNKTLEFHLKAENYLAVLKGKIEIFLKINTPFGSKDFTFVLFEWEGWSWYWIIYEDHKTTQI